VRVEGRLGGFMRLLRRRRIDAALVFGEADIRSLVGFPCDNGCLVVAPDFVFFVTDFRYVPMAHRLAPALETVEAPRGMSLAAVAAKRLARAGVKPVRIGFEDTVSAARYLDAKKTFSRSAFVEVGADLLGLRAVKTPDEIARVAAAEALTVDVWNRVKREVRPGMTEKEVQRLVRAYFNAYADGEAFETIVCAGANAAECHHVPDDTVWKKDEPLLVDMGAKLDGMCGDLTRCIPARKREREYARVYAAVRAANRAAIAAAKPGVTTGSLDCLARGVLRKAGLARAFGHALGHGVGYEIHECPVARPHDDTVLEPGMCLTIEPGVYLEGRLGIRIEDLVLITSTGCEVLSKGAEK